MTAKSRQPNAVPVRVRGATYGSISAAAKALGLHRKSIQTALDEGREDVVGLSKRPRRAALEAADAS